MKLLKPFTLAVFVTAVAVSVAEDGEKSKAAAVVERLAKEADASQLLDDSVKTYVKEKLLPLSTNEVFVKAVEAQNAKKLTLADIKKTDKEWTEAEDELPIQKELMGNDCAKEIKRLAKELTAMGETFVMDNQGANVGQNALTSDYWQGDEPKWQEPFDSGKGKFYAEKPKLDRSTNTVEQKISLPILDKDGKAIGAVCIGVMPEKTK